MKKFTISENDVYNMILKEMNDNEFGVNFEMSNFYVNKDMDGNISDLQIYRMAFNVNDGRFDVKDTFNEETYSTNKIGFTAMGISGLGSQFLANENIVEANFSPIIEFLISVDDSTVFLANKYAIEEVRSRLIQKLINYYTENLDLNNPNSTEKIKQLLKVSYASGEIDWGTTIDINGRYYLTATMVLNIFVTTSGEFANQQEFYFYTSEIIDTETNKPKRFKIPLINWHYGKGVGTEDYQLLANTSTFNNIGRASEGKSIPTTKAFALQFLVEIDFENEYLTEIYKDSVMESISTPTYYIEFVTKKLNKTTNEYETLVTNKRAYVLTTNSPDEELSLGDKIYHNLVFSPSLKGWFE